MGGRGWRGGRCRIEGGVLKWKGGHDNTDRGGNIMYKWVYWEIVLLEKIQGIKINNRKEKLVFFSFSSLFI